MSEETVELARQHVETFNARGLDGAEDLWHPDIELHDPPNFPDADRHAGKVAYRQQVQNYLDLGWDGQIRGQEYLDAGDEVVIIWQAHVRAPHGGGLPLENTYGFVFQFEDGKLRRVRQYLTRAETLEAAGLSE
jgi:ketosteroid isomerase-like protein